MSTPATIDYAALQRQSKIAAALTALASILVLGSLLFSYYKTVQAEQDLKKITSQIDSDKKLKAGLEAEIASLTSQRQHLVTLLNDVASSSKAATQTLDASVKASPTLASTVARVFVHVNKSTNPEVAAAIQKNLRAKGYVVPTPDNVANNHDASQLQLHYFYNDEGSKKDVAQIQDELKALGIASTAMLIQDPNIKIPPERTYGIYLARE